jgi:hypothetical protein
MENLIQIAYLDYISVEGNKRTLLFDIIEQRVEKSEPKLLYKDILDNMQKFCGIQSYATIALISSSNGLNYDELVKTEILMKYEKDTKFKTYINRINKLAFEYGNELMVALRRMENPFLFVGIQTNVQPQNRFHNIQFRRADGELFVAEYEVGLMLDILSVLHGSIIRSFEIGNYNLTKEQVEKYISSSQELNKKLLKMGESKE